MTFIVAVCTKISVSDYWLSIFASGFKPASVEPCPRLSVSLANGHFCRDKKRKVEGGGMKQNISREMGGGCVIFVTISTF